MAEAELVSSGSGVSPEEYGIWLRSKCLPAVIDDVCQPILGHFVMSVRYVAEMVGDVHSPEDVRMRSVLWTMYAEEQLPHTSTKNLESRLANILMEEKAPYWDGRAEQTRPVCGPQKAGPSTQEATSPEDGPATPGSLAGVPAVEQPAVMRIPRRVPDLDLSRERLQFRNNLATELAAVKQEVRVYRTVEELKVRYPKFVLWRILSDPEIGELVSGAPFFPKAFADALTMRKFGFTSRETLKKDRKKLRQAQRNQRKPPAS